MKRARDYKRLASERMFTKFGKVFFGEQCNQCMACIQWCSQRAIYFDKKETKRKRYHNPNIAVNELCR